MQFTKEELNNIGLLINKAPLTGQEATTVALLLQKIGKLIEEQNKPSLTKEINKILDLPTENKKV